MAPDEEKITPAERIASIAIKFLWLAVLSFVVSSCIGEESEWAKYFIWTAIGGLGAAVLLGIFATVLGVQDRKRYYNVRKEMYSRIKSERQAWERDNDKKQ